jgi:hypothetical protein
VYSRIRPGRLRHILDGDDPEIDRVGEKSLPPREQRSFLVAEPARKNGWRVDTLMGDGFGLYPREPTGGPPR